MWVRATRIAPERLKHRMRADARVVRDVRATRIAPERLKHRVRRELSCPYDVRATRIAPERLKRELLRGDAAGAGESERPESRPSD